MQLRVLLVLASTLLLAPQRLQSVALPPVAQDRQADEAAHSSTGSNMGDVMEPARCGRPRVHYGS